MEFAHRKNTKQQDERHAKSEMHQASLEIKELEIRMRLLRVIYLANKDRKKPTWSWNGKGKVNIDYTTGNISSK